MRQAEGQQKSHDRDDQRKIGEPGRIGRDEWRHGIEHQKYRERGECNALRQRQPGNGEVETGLTGGPA